MAKQQPLKDVQIRVNLDEETLRLAKEISKALGTTPTALGRVLVEKFVEAHQSHGDRLPWPPRFQYYESDPVVSFRPYEIRKNGRVMRAAEENP